MPTGEPPSLDQHRGKLVLVAFWGASCGPCLNELPNLERLADRFRDAGLIVLPVCVDPADAAEATTVASRPDLALAGLRRCRWLCPAGLRRASPADDRPDRSSRPADRLGPGKPGLVRGEVAGTDRGLPGPAVIALASL